MHWFQPQKEEHRLWCLESQSSCWWRHLELFPSSRHSIERIFWVNYLTFAWSTFNFSFILKIFFIWTIFKSWLNSLQYYFCLTFWCLGYGVCSILAPGVKPALLALKSDVLTTGASGKSLIHLLERPSLMPFSKVINGPVWTQEIDAKERYIMENAGCPSV